MFACPLQSLWSRQNDWKIYTRWGKSLEGEGVAEQQGASCATIQWCRHSLLRPHQLLLLLAICLRFCCATLESRAMFERVVPCCGSCGFNFDQSDQWVNVFGLGNCCNSPTTVSIVAVSVQNSLSCPGLRCGLQKTRKAVQNVTADKIANASGLPTGWASGFLSALRPRAILLTPLELLIVDRRVEDVPVEVPDLHRLPCKLISWCR